MVKDSAHFITEVLDKCDMKVDHVRSIEIRAQVNDVVVMTIKKLITEEQVEEIKKIL